MAARTQDPGVPSGGDTLRRERVWSGQLRCVSVALAQLAQSAVAARQGVRGVVCAALSRQDRGGTRAAQRHGMRCRRARESLRGYPGFGIT